MNLNIKINPTSEIPKYQQIVGEIKKLVRRKILRKGDILPPINEMYKTLGVGRVTVVSAYNELKKTGVIESAHGKGFYIKNGKAAGTIPVLLLFDVMNSYKEVLYKSIVTSLGPRYFVDIFFHYYNYKEFSRILTHINEDYQHIIVLPHFNFDVSPLLKKISKEKLLILDKDVENLNDGYAAIYQNFFKITFESLLSAKELILKYNKINFVFQEYFQFTPTGIIDGFKKFGEKCQISTNIIANLTEKDIGINQVYFVLADIDLITVLKYVKKHKLKLGKDIGLISFDDTPLKTVLEDGITTISTDFEYMGKMAAKMIREKLYYKVENPSGIIIRNSL